MAAMTNSLTRSQRLMLIIGISFCFFVAEISGELSIPIYHNCVTHMTSSSWILHTFTRTRCRCLPLCEFKCSDIRTKYTFIYKS